MLYQTNTLWFLWYFLDNLVHFSSFIDNWVKGNFVHGSVWHDQCLITMSLQGCQLMMHALSFSLSTLAYRCFKVPNWLQLLLLMLQLLVSMDPHFKGAISRSSTSSWPRWQTTPLLIQCVDHSCSWMGNVERDLTASMTQDLALSVVLLNASTPFVKTK